MTIKDALFKAKSGEVGQIDLVDGYSLVRDDRLADLECRGAYDKTGGYTGEKMTEGNPDVWHLDHRQKGRQRVSLDKLPEWLGLRVIRAY